MFTHFFIDRPILSSVISILFVLAGLVAMSVAPIEQYPELAPPSVNIGASYPGATADVIASQVASPIERSSTASTTCLYFSSASSSSGSVSINVVFKPGSDPDINQVNVQNRVSQALSLLPQTVTQQGVGARSSRRRS
jgi:multidrug efflux pump